MDQNRICSIYIQPLPQRTNKPKTKPNAEDAHTRWSNTHNNNQNNRQSCCFFFASTLSIEPIKIARLTMFTTFSKASNTRFDWIEDVNP